MDFLRSELLKAIALKWEEIRTSFSEAFSLMLNVLTRISVVSNAGLHQLLLATT